MDLLKIKWEIYNLKAFVLHRKLIVGGEMFILAVANQRGRNFVSEKLVKRENIKMNSTIWNRTKSGKIHSENKAKSPSRTRNHSKCFPIRCTIFHQLSTNSSNCEGSEQHNWKRWKCWRRASCRGEFAGAVIVVLFTVILHEGVGHFVKKVPNEEPRVHAARPPRDVLGAVQVFFKRAAKFGQIKVNSC